MGKPVLPEIDTSQGLAISDLKRDQYEEQMQWSSFERKDENPVVVVVTVETGSVDQACYQAGRIAFQSCFWRV